jgi:hypothetical protein
VSKKWGSYHIVSIKRILENNENFYIRDEFRSSIKSGSPVYGKMLKRSETRDFDSLKKGNLVKIIDSNENLLAVHRVLSSEMSADINCSDLKLTEIILIL